MSAVSALNVARPAVNVTRRASTSSSSSKILKGGLPSLPIRASKAVTLRASAAPRSAHGVYAQLNVNADADPRNSPIARMAAGLEQPSAAVPTINKPFNVSELVSNVLSGLWKMRKVTAGIAFALVLALADAAPAMAGRGGGGRSGGRMGGSSFRAPSARPMVRHLATSLQAKSQLVFYYLIRIRVESHPHHPPDQFPT
jgi:hypothetical protein